MSNFNPFSQSAGAGANLTEHPLMNRRVRDFYERAESKNPRIIKPNMTFVSNKEKSLGKVLVVDDDLFSLSTVSSPLIKMGYDVTVADSYRQSISQLINQDFDLVVLDYILADATGYDVLKKSEEILGALFTDKVTPIVTYSTQEQQHMKVPELSIFNYLGHWKKPLKKKELYALMKTL